MLDFGKSLEGKIRPIATVTTPLSIEYEGSDNFADSLKELDRYFQVEFHGHFGHYAPSQFRREVDLLTKCGFKPTIYAGGWWIMNETIAGLLDRNNFAFDTSMTDVGLTSFGQPQSLPDDHKFKEIPTMRHLYNTIRGGTFCLSFHDFDLLDLKAKLYVDILKNLALRSKVKSFDEL